MQANGVAICICDPSDTAQREIGIGADLRREYTRANAQEDSQNQT